MKTLKKKNAIVRLATHPLGIYLLAIITFLLFCIIGIPILSSGYADGEQVPLTLFAHAVSAAAIIFILISIVSPIIYWSWYKKYMFVPLFIPIIVAGLLIYLIIDVYISNGHHFAF